MGFLHGFKGAPPAGRAYGRNRQRELAHGNPAAARPHWLTISQHNIRRGW
jgi:hypothetical protein